MLDRDDTRAVSDACEGTGWVAREGTLSNRGAVNVMHVYEFAGWLRFLVKPLIIFWRIMGSDFVRTPSPTRHFWGHNCPVPTLAATPLHGETPAARANEALRFVETHAQAHHDATLTFGRVLEKAVDDDQPERIGETEVVAHFTAGNVSAAHQVCREVLGNRRRASHTHSIVHDGLTLSFFERAVLWTPDTA